MIKKALLILFLSLPAGRVFALDITNITAPGASGSAGQNLANWVQTFYSFSLIGGVFLAVGVIVWAGLKYTLAAGNPSTQSDARDQILQALLGLALLFGAYLILYTINPNLTNLAPVTLKGVMVPGVNYSQDKGNYQVQDLKQVGQQIGQAYKQDNNAQVEIPIKTGSDQEQQNISAQCMVNTHGTKSTAAKGIKPGVYVCI